MCVVVLLVVRWLLCVARCLVLVVRCFGVSVFLCVVFGVWCSLCGGW